MKRDAHYYALYAFCRASGFKKESAYVIAYASQFVDDAMTNLIYIDNPKSSVECYQFGQRKAFHNIATAHSYFRIKTFNYESMIKNTSAFHFVPGLKGKSFTKKLRCLEESPIILDILEEVLKEDDLVKFGMVLHTYADTFAHQGFSGLISKVNDIKNCNAVNENPKGFIGKITDKLKYLGQAEFDQYFDRLMPGYGHGQALDFPDLPYLVWSYEYDTSTRFNGCYNKIIIDNRDRYRRAFAKIKSYLEAYLLKYPHHKDASVEFTNFDLLYDALILKASDRVREWNWREVLLEQELLEASDEKYLKYDREAWLKEAFSNFSKKVFNNRTVEGAKLVPGFEDTNWYHFVQGVKWYKRQFFNYASKYGLDIPR